MTDYEKAVALWQQKNVTTDAELAEALNGHSIAFTYHSGKIENENITYNDTRESFALEAWDTTQDIVPLREFLKAQTGKTWLKPKRRRL